MEYRVELSRRAERDSEEAFLHIRQRAPLNTVRWRHGLEAKLRVLERMPEWFALAPENQDTSIEVRQLLYGRYRILYTVRGSTVFVRRGSRRNHPRIGESITVQFLFAIITRSVMATLKSRQLLIRRSLRAWARGGEDRCGAGGGRGGRW